MGNLNFAGKNVSHQHTVHHKSHIYPLRLNPVLRCEGRKLTASAKEFLIIHVYIFHM